MGKGEHQQKPQRLESWDDEMDAIARHIQDRAQTGRVLEILEAGCGRRWGLDLKDLKYTLTGVDQNQDALEYRKKAGDLDTAVLADLHTVSLSPNAFDVIFNSNVLEHIDGAEKLLDRFVSWLKPGGILALIFPNRYSAKGFLTRISPFWLHVFYKRYVQGYKDAGTPGTDPFPTYFDTVVSMQGMRSYCQQRGLHIVAEYYSDTQYTTPYFRIIYNILMWFVFLMSFGRLSLDKTELVYIISTDVPES